jgi:glycosyltransferase involved in cell wall biosynthesis
MTQREHRPRSLSVVIPAYNEAENLEAAVATALAAAVELDEIEIVLVDDGSTDATPAIADRLAARRPEVRAVHHACNRGFAAAYRSGLQLARHEYFTFLPGDNEIAPESIHAIFAAIGGADLVVPYHATPWKRTWARRALTWIATTQVNVLFGWRARYYQGPTVYPTRLARVLPVRATKFFFITEMLVQALSAGCSYVEVGLTHQERTHGQSKAVALSNILEAEATILRLWWNIRVRGRLAVPKIDSSDGTLAEGVPW